MPVALSLVLCLALSLVPAPSAAAQPVDSAVVGPAEPTYDLAPYYLASPELAEAYDRYKSGAHRDASDALEQALETLPKSDATRAPLTYLAAVVARAAGRHKLADRHLGALTGYGPLASRVHWALARRTRRAGKRSAALAHLEAVADDSPEHPRALVERAKLLRAAKRRADEAAVLRRAIRDCRRGLRSRLRLSLTEALVASGKRKEAKRVLADLMSDDPAGESAKTARRKYRKLVEGGSFTQRLVAMVSNANGHNAGRLRKELKKIRRGLKGRERRAVMDYAEGVVFCQRKSTRPKSLKRFRAAWRATKRKELKGWILLGWARALVRSEEAAAGRKKAEKLLKELPRHAAVAEARLLLARLHADADEFARGVAVLGPLVEAAEPGAEALWWHGWLHWRGGAPEAARSSWAELARHHATSSTPGGAAIWRERAEYWMGRALEAEGDTAGAVEQWSALVRRAPFTYYAYAALSRVEETAPERVAELLPPRPPVDDPSASPADLRRLRIRRDPRLATAVTLLRLGLYEQASKELEYRLARGTLPPDGLVLAGALRVRTGDLHRAHRLIRRYGRYATYPDARSAAHWRLAYPLAFWELVREYATGFGVPPFLMMSLMRHESGFRTDVRSYARAVGLVQLLPSTARSVAKRLLQVSPPSARDLRNPALNLLISTRYVRELDSLFAGNLALAISAYNAGPGRMKRWWRERSRLETDEFLEEMPFSNTAAYTMKVLASYTAYSFLYGDDRVLPSRARPLPRRLPADLGPYMKRDEALLGPATVPEREPR